MMFANAALGAFPGQHFFFKRISTHLLLAAIGFCLVLSGIAGPYLRVLRYLFVFTGYI